MTGLVSTVAALPCSYCPEPTVVFVLDLVGDASTVRLCETHWRDRVAVEQEHRL